MATDLLLLPLQQQRVRGGYMEGRKKEREKGVRMTKRFNEVTGKK